MSASTMVTGPDDESCPRCGDITGVSRVVGTQPGVHEWACTVCGMGWAITTVDPQPYLDRLTASIERLNAARSLARQLHALAEETFMITNEELADQLLALADRARTLP